METKYTTEGNVVMSALLRRWFGENPVEESFGIRFSNRTLLALILPLLAEQLLGMLMGTMDTMMVSSLGDASVSGVSLVDMIFILFFNILSALSTGGAVVASRAIGAKKPEEARRSAVGLMIITLSASLLILALLYGFDEEILTLLYGSIEPDVKEAALTYMRITALSFPAVALYSAAAALFRSMGNSKISMYASAGANAVNVAGNAFLIFVMDMGVAGAALATVIGRVLLMIFFLIMIGRKTGDIYIDYGRLFREKPDTGLMKSILAVGLPGSLESGTFQLGRILVLSIISTFGTVQITANAIANNIDSFGIMPGFAFNLAIITVVGQCVGAGDKRAVQYYTGKLMRMCCGFLVVLNIVLFAVLPLMLNLYSISDEARELAVILIIIHNGFGILLWTPSFVLPNAMKATGDAKFVMVTAVLSMFIFRVALSYVLGIRFGMGAVGVWICMVIDWICRIICFTARFEKKIGFRLK